MVELLLNIDFHFYLIPAVVVPSVSHAFIIGSDFIVQNKPLYAPISNDVSPNIPPSDFHIYSIENVTPEERLSAKGVIKSFYEDSSEH